MSVANSLIKPTYPPQPTQAGYTIVSSVVGAIQTTETEIIRQKLTPGIWLMSCCLTLTGTSQTFQFGVRIEGLPYIAVQYFSTHNLNPYSFTMSTPILVLEPSDILLIGSSTNTALTIGDGTLVQFTRLS